MVELAVGEWINTSEGAELTGFSVDYVRRLARAGRIGARKTGRDWLVNKKSALAYAKKMEELGTAKHNPRRGNS